MSSGDEEPEPAIEEKPTSIFKKAGILPISFTPRHANLALLLGKIRSSSSWVKSDRLYSDFAGRSSTEDEDEYEAASREFLEESLGQITVPGIPDNELTVKRLAQHLREGHYLFRIETTRIRSKYNQKNVSNTDFRCVTFILEIPFCQSICKKFREYRKKLLHCATSQTTSQTTQVSKDLQEWAELQPALIQKESNPDTSTNSSTFKLLPQYNEIESIGYYICDYTLSICERKDSKKKLSVLHNTRKRFLHILPVLLEYEQLRKKQLQLLQQESFTNQANDTYRSFHSYNRK